MENSALHIDATAEPVSEMDRLGAEIAELSAHLDAATARLLDLIREFDARGGWNHGCRSCAHWLAWRVGMNLGAARERVRVARALGSLPRLAEALACGELSYAKVRALTRVATEETEERLLAVGLAGTACHVERIVRGWRRVDTLAETRETTHRHKSRALHVYEDKDGMVVIRGRLTPEAGAVLRQALRQALDAARETVVSADARHGRCQQPGGGLRVDYALSRSDDIPPPQIDHLETPSPLNPLGLKGVGESGALPVAAVVASVVEDAPTERGIRVEQMPLTSGTPPAGSLFRTVIARPRGSPAS